MIRKDRRRYLIFRIIAKNPEHISPEKLGAYIWEEIVNLYGIDIAVNMQFAIITKKFDPTGWNIIRINHKYVDRIKTVLSFAYNFEQPIIIRFYKVTGTIRKARKIISEISPKVEHNSTNNE